MDRIVDRVVERGASAVAGLVAREVVTGWIAVGRGVVAGLAGRGVVAGLAGIGVVGGLARRGVVVAGLAVLAGGGVVEAGLAGRGVVVVGLAGRGVVVGGLGVVAALGVGRTVVLDGPIRDGI